jgi:hypothetical protein
VKLGKERNRLRHPKTTAYKLKLAKLIYKLNDHDNPITPEELNSITQQIRSEYQYCYNCSFKFEHEGFDCGKYCSAKCAELLDESIAPLVANVDGLDVFRCGNFA